MSTDCLNSWCYFCVSFVVLKNILVSSIFNIYRYTVPVSCIIKEPAVLKNYCNI
jgi:hypothetical protein